MFFIFHGWHGIGFPCGFKQGVLVGFGVFVGSGVLLGSDVLLGTNVCVGLGLLVLGTWDVGSFAGRLVPGPELGVPIGGVNVKRTGW